MDWLDESEEYLEEYNKEKELIHSYKSKPEPYQWPPYSMDWDYKLPIDTPINKPQPEIKQKRITHYTGHSDSVRCQACGIYKDNKSIDFWVVMRKTWMIEDLHFTRCKRQIDCDLKNISLIFIDSPTVSPPIEVIEIRKDLISILSSSYYGSLASVKCLEFLKELEISVASFYVKIKREVKSYLPSLSATQQDIMLRVLKSVYLNS